MTTTKNEQHLWQQVEHDLRTELGEARWLSTFADSLLLEEPSECNATLEQPAPSRQFQLVASNKIARDNINSKHLDDVKRLIAKYEDLPADQVGLEVQLRQGELLPPPTDFEAVLPPPNSSNGQFHDQPHPNGAAAGDPTGGPADDPTGNSYSQLADGPGDTSRNGADSDSDPSGGASNYNPRFRFENFVNGSNSRFAYQAMLAVAEHPGEHYNPLFVYGNVGLGKTHLLQATANFVRQYYPEKRTMYVATETFLNDFLVAIRKKQGEKFREKYRQLDVLILDDIQVLEGKESTQEEIFHTFNYLYENKKQLIFSSDRPPDALQTLENRLRSRFKSGLMTDIQPPDIETRLVILAQNVEQHNQKQLSMSRPATEVPQDILGFIAENFTENVRELEGALTKVLAHAELMGVTPTLDLAEKLLSDLISSNPTQLPSAQEIICLATELFAVAEKDLTGKSRTQDLVTARHITMYAIREHTDLSFPAIGEYFSGRDHSSVMHAVSKVKTQMKENHETYQQVLTLTTSIKAAKNSALVG